MEDPVPLTIQHKNLTAVRNFLYVRDLWRVKPCAICDLHVLTGRLPRALSHPDIQSYIPDYRSAFPPNPQTCGLDAQN